MDLDFFEPLSLTAEEVNDEYGASNVSEPDTTQ